MMDSLTLGRLTILGTTHVDKASIVRVRDLILLKKPSVVAVELCAERYSALKYQAASSTISPFVIGLLPSILALLEKTVGERTHIFPGSEMLAAVETAERIGAKIEFLDRPISETIALIRSIPLREKITLLIDAVVTLFSISTGINLGEPISRNLSELLDAFKDRYPNLYRILVEDRDRLIAHRLKSILLCERGSIVAVVGIGHLRGLSRFLFKGSEAPQIPVVRLSLQWAIKTYGL